MKVWLPINNQRGGSIFTMIIFIMMLISTALMYYYYQRTRSLERDLLALQSGEPLPGEVQTGFLDFLTGTPPERPGDTGNTAATSAVRPSHPAVNTQENALPPAGTPITEVPGNTAPQVAVSPPPVESDTIPDDTLPQDTLPPAEQFSTAEAVDEGESDAASAASSSDESQSRPNAPAESSADAAEGQSLYNLDPPPVRVRAPRR